MILIVKLAPVGTLGRMNIQNKGVNYEVYFTNDLFVDLNNMVSDRSLAFGLGC